MGEREREACPKENSNRSLIECMPASEVDIKDDKRTFFWLFDLEGKNGERKRNPINKLRC